MEIPYFFDAWAFDGVSKNSLSWRLEKFNSMYIFILFKLGNV